MTGFITVLDSIDDLNLNQIHSLLHLATVFHEYPSQTNRLKDKRLCTFFLENSTRTKFSFQIAAQNLGMHILDVDPTKTSLNKGESLLETFRTFHAQGVDVIAIRSSEDGLLLPFKESAPLALINAGDGKREHPTQALLDLFTIKQIFPKYKKLNILIVGDCKHSRVAGSLCKLLPQFEMNVTLCGPDYFLPHEKLGKEVLHTTDLKTALQSADLIYLLRVQKERHHDSISQSDYINTYGMTLEKVKALGRPIPVLHPGPFNLGIEIDEALVETPIYKLATGYAGYLQVENSIYMRMSILTHLLKESL